MTSLGPRQSCDEIHSDFFPFPLRNLQRLQQSGRALMLYLYHLTSITFGDVKSYFTLHTVPPKLALYVLIHLCPSRMKSISRFMSLLQYELLQFFIIGYTQTSLVQQYSFRIKAEPIYFFLLHPEFNSLNARITWLCLLNLLAQCGLKFQVCQVSMNK